MRQAYHAQRIHIGVWKFTKKLVMGQFSISPTYSESLPAFAVERSTQALPEILMLIHGTCRVVMV